jgi:hypothetical protein
MGLKAALMFGVSVKEILSESFALWVIGPFGLAIAHAALSFAALPLPHFDRPMIASFFMGNEIFLRGEGTGHRLQGFTIAFLAPGGPPRSKKKLETIQRAFLAILEPSFQGSPIWRF